MTTTQPAEGTPLVYQCALPLSRQTLTFIADLLRARLKKIGSRWRKLPPGRIALIVLATLRHDHRLADMAGGNGVSASTISRWTWEVIGLLAARAPRLDRALAKITRQGKEVVLLDGTLIPTRRRSGTANRRNYNGKHKRHGLLFLALTDEAGNLIWISSARRGAASEITAARHDHLADRLRAAGLAALADLGFTECRAVDAALEGAKLDDTFTFREKTTSVRWMWQHLVEEYARHNGHADLLREAIDGSAGL